MPVINLKIQGKQAIGDGTKIVCVNGDYTVRIECVDCDTFVNLPVKKLILKAGLDYHESPITTVDGQLQAELPIIENQKGIELGVCGKETENGDPEFASRPAVFECVRSVLCGAVVLRKDPVLESLVVRANGTYTAAERNVDGFYEVHVAVPGTESEVRTVELSMAGGSQLIEPSAAGRTMSRVVVSKPQALIPENIRAGYSIGGVVGTYDKILTETEVFKDGEYTPPEGFDGFSKVTVRVESSNYTKLLRVGECFDYEYDSGVNITLDTPNVVKYENSGKSIVFTAIGKGSCSVILKDLDKDSKVVNTVHYAIVVELESEHLMPQEAATLDAMELYLKEGAPGGIVKYTGVTSNGFIKNELYIIQEGE